MRILHVTDVYLPRFGGIELHVRDLAQRQAEQGHEVEILTLTGSRGAAELPGALVVHRPAGSRWPAKVTYGARTRAFGRDHGFDVVHAHASTISPLSFFSLRANQPVPTVITVHSLWRYYTPLYRAFDLTKRWSRWPVVWSAVSEAAAQGVARGAVRPLEVPVLPNGIDLDEWPLVRRVRCPDEYRVVSVMRLAARKRPLPLLRMLRSLRDVVSDDVRLTAVIVGDGPMRADMERYIARHDMGEWVELTGQLPRPSVAEVLAGADVFVAPARLESFGIAALEARATGLPVVGRLRSGLSDFITDGHDGLLVGDDAAMVAALARLATTPLAAAALRDRSRVEQMSWPTVLARTMDCYARAGVRATDVVSQRAAS